MAQPFVVEEIDSEDFERLAWQLQKLSEGDERAAARDVYRESRQEPSTSCRSRCCPAT